MQNFHHFMASRHNKPTPTLNQLIKNTQQYKQSAHNDDDKYLMEDDSQANQNRLDQQNSISQNNQPNQDYQLDPLDAFMQGLESELGNLNNTQKSKKQNNRFKNDLQSTNDCKKDKQRNSVPLKKNNNDKSQQQIEIDQEGDEQFESFLHPNFNHSELNEQSNDQGINESQICEVEGGNLDEWSEDVGNKKSSKIIQTLKPFDFSRVQLEDFEKDFYDEHQDIERLTEQQIKNIRKQFGIKLSGEDIPKPIISFGHLELDSKIKQVIMKEQFQKPTPIQAQALPVALKGRDLIGVAKTGSGKTLAYVWPMITHVGHQRESKKGEGPIALVLAPTRQLCQQIYVQGRKYSRKYDMKIACLLGGQNKHQQWKTLKSGVDILIASPGRLIEMIKKKATNMQRVTYLVLDQADKMLSLGFQQQIRSIVSQTRPDRQTLLFTATMKKSIQFLAYDILQSPIRIFVGEENAANEDVKQQVVVIDEKEQKLQWLKNNLTELLEQGKVLIFCNQKDSCESVAQFISSTLFLPVLTLHGDKAQYERTAIMNSFKSSQSILIATDIASRGIDVKNIKTVINFECPKNIQPYIHRIGRAGRAGQTGTAISFLDKSQGSIKFAIQLVKIFENSGYPVSKQLEDLACLDDFYRRKRISSKMGVSFAKGKDASKFLNQILKQQQKGNSKAGLGMSINLQTHKQSGKEKNKYSFVKSNLQNQEEQYLQGEDKSIAELLAERNIMSENLSISELSKIIRQIKQSKDRKTLASSKLKSHFVRSTDSKPKQNRGNLQAEDARNYGEEVTVSFFKRKK